MIARRYLMKTGQGKTDTGTFCLYQIIWGDKDRGGGLSTFLAIILSHQRKICARAFLFLTESKTRSIFLFYRIFSD